MLRSEAGLLKALRVCFFVCVKLGSPKVPEKHGWAKLINLREDQFLALSLIRVSELLTSSPPQLTLNNTLLTPFPSINRALQIVSFFSFQYSSLHYTAGFCARRSSVACTDKLRGARFRINDDAPAVCAQTVQSVNAKSPLARRWWRRQWAPVGMRLWLEHLHQLVRTHWEWRCWVLFTTDTPHQ